MHPIHKHMSSRMRARKADERYDAKEAYNKNLSGKARLHYLENDIADKGMSMKSPMDMGHKAPAKMKSAMDMKAPMKKAGKMSPADMKAPMKKEGPKQERKDLMKDNPVVRDMDSSRPWMSKHASQSRMGGSPLKNEDGKDASLLARGGRAVKKAVKKIGGKVKDVVSGAAEGIQEFSKDMQKRGT